MSSCYFWAAVHQMMSPLTKAMGQAEAVKCANAAASCAGDETCRFARGTYPAEFYAESTKDKRYLIVGSKRKSAMLEMVSYFSTGLCFLGLFVCRR